MSWQIMDVLSFIGKCVTISRPNGDIKDVYIKNILLDRLGHRIVEILYIENKGSGKTCHLIVGRDTLIKPTGETPTLKLVDSHQTINDLAGDV